MTLAGYPRLVCGMNNADGFPFIQKGSVTPEDVQAVADRLCWIEMPADPNPEGADSPSALYLRAHKAELASWVGGRFAEHAAWLRETRTGCAELKPGDRMAAPPLRGDVIVRRMSTTGQHDRQIKEIITFLETGELPPMSSGEPLKRVGSECWALASWLEDRTRDLLCVLGAGGKKRLQVSGQRLYYRPIDLTKLYQARPAADWELIDERFPDAR